MDKINLSELKERATVIVKEKKAWEGVLELIDESMKIQSSIHELTAENTRLEISTKAARTDMAVLTSKIDIARKDLTSRNIVIGQKIKRQEQLDEYLAGGFKSKEAALERESNERIGSMRTRELNKIKAIKAETDDVEKELKVKLKALESANEDLAEINQGIKKYLASTQ